MHLWQFGTPDDPLSHPFTEQDRQQTTDETTQQVENSQEPHTLREEQDIAKRQTTKRGIRTQKANIDEQAASWADQDRCISQRRKTSQQEGTCHIDQQDIIRPPIAKV